MMSASAISAAIRAKKKKMVEKMDPIDAVVKENKEYASQLSENNPKENDEDPASMAEEARSGGHEDSAPDPHQINQPEDGPEKEEKAARMLKMRKMMARMGK